MGESLRGSAPAPKHVRVREHVQALLAGASPGTPAPSERELARDLGVARMTVRQAIEALVADGSLERSPGRGTFVARPRAPLTAVAGLTEELTSAGRSVETRTLLARREQAGVRVARALAMDAGEAVVHWQRLRLADGEPLSLEDVYLPARLTTGLAGQLPSSLYSWLEERGLRPTRVEDRWTADTAGPAEAAQLGLPVSGTVLCKKRRGFCRGRVVELSRAVFRADRYVLRLSLGER